MATWQFDFHLVPAASIERHFRTMPVAVGEGEYETLPWWEGFADVDDLEAELTKLLPLGASWHPETKTWGDEDGDRFDVTRDGQAVTEVCGRLDVRHLSLPFLNRVAEVARKWNLMIVTEDGHILRPSLKEILSAIHRSRSFAFVTDPEGFLKRLANTE